MENEMKIVNWEQDFLYTTEKLSAVKRVKLVSDSMPYIVLRGPWCNIIVLNVHTPNEEKSDDSRQY
jgi:hypothetical protein